MDFDKNLGVYPSDNLSQWQGLSNYITNKVLQKLEPYNQTILSEQKERELRDQEDNNGKK